MPWSTRELAELAGTTVNTIRHYHRVGLLTQPQRRYNGYKQYEVAHLVKLLRIRRLVDLGLSLPSIADMALSSDDTSEALQALDEELEVEIERLQNSRAALAAITRERAPADVPRGFEAVAARLSEADSSMVHIYTQLYDDDALGDLRDIVETAAEAISQDIDSLPADADEETKVRLAEALAPIMERYLIDYPWLTDPGPHLSKGVSVTQETFVEALVALYNPAQLDVFARASVLAHERLAARQAASTAPEATIGS